MEVSKARAIVTGAGSGIGLATARALLQGGSPAVGLLVRRQESYDAALAELAEEADAERLVPLIADVRDADALKAAFEYFMESAGKLDVLVNNAGVLLDGAAVSFSFKGVTRYPLESLRETFDTNLMGSFLCAQLGAEHMLRKRSKGVIINISSVSRNGRPGQAAYSASKGGIVSMTSTLAQELAPFKIRCAAIAPGLIATPMAERIPEAYRKEMLSSSAAGRMGQPEEIGHGVIFCIENDFFNGSALELDGGAFG